MPNKQSTNPRSSDPNAPVRYVHGRCQSSTLPTQETFFPICDSFQACEGVYCQACQAYVPLEEVTWEDTGESLADFRRRLEANVPRIVRLWRGWLGFVPGALLGLAIGWLVFQTLKLPRAKESLAIGGGAGAAIVYVVGGLLLQRIYGVKDGRRLREEV